VIAMEVDVVARHAHGDVYVSMPQGDGDTERRSVDGTYVFLSSPSRACLQ